MTTPDKRFETLYRSHGDAVRGYCIRRLGHDDGVDAAADVFVTVWRRIDACPPGDEARLWMFGVARNIVANRWRSVARGRALIDKASRNIDPEVDTTESVVVRRTEYDELATAVMALPDRYREVLILAEWDGLDRESIAQLEGVSRSAIDQRISRAYKKLARKMNRKAPRQTMFVVPHAIKEGGEA